MPRLSFAVLFALFLATSPPLPAAAADIGDLVTVDEGAPVVVACTDADACADAVRELIADTGPAAPAQPVLVSAAGEQGTPPAGHAVLPEVWPARVERLPLVATRPLPRPPSEQAWLHDLNTLGDPSPAGLVFVQADIGDGGLGGIAGTVGLLDQLLSGGWGAAALNPQLWILLFTIVWVVWKLINPVAAEQAYKKVKEIAADAKKIGEDLYWSVEESGRRSGLDGQSKRTVFEARLPARLEAAGVPATAENKTLATEAMEGLNGRRKAAAGAAANLVPPDPTPASAKA